MTEMEIQQELNSIFNRLVTVKNTANHSTGDVTLAICDMRYSPSSDSAGITQTVVLLQAPDLDFPEFTMRSPSSGLLTGLLGNTSLSFPDCPEFDAVYSVSGTLKEAIQVVFSAEVREQLTALPGWQIRANGTSLVAYQSRKIFAQEDRDEFMSTALQILQTLRTGEAELDARPDVSREATGADMLKSVQQMDGFGRSAMLSQLEKIALSHDELDNFCAASCPREIPKGMEKQVLGASKGLLLVGPIFTFMPIVVCVVLWFAGQGWVALTPLCTTVLGPIVFFFALNFRSKKLRTLRNGTIVSGVVDEVRATDVQMNNHVRHYAFVSYELNGETTQAKANVYGSAADNAKRRVSDKCEVRVLVDPQDPSHVIVLDLLLVF